MKIILFGQLKELSPGGTVEGPDVGDSMQLRLWLENRFPSIRELPYLIAVDKKIVDATVAVGADQEIAILPPYSGG